MKNLIKQELKRNSMQGYIVAALFSCIGLTVFIYFIAYVSLVENEVQFQSYENIIRFLFVMALMVFSILSATMYSRFIIDEYSGARLSLLFSYPVNRKKILQAKVLVVVILIMVFMTISILVPLTIFFITEQFYTLVPDTFSENLIGTTLYKLILSVIAVLFVGVVSMRIGFVKKSVPTVLISSFILSGIMGNAIINLSGNIVAGFVLALILVFLSIATVIELANKVNKMEVE